MLTAEDIKNLISEQKQVFTTKDDFKTLTAGFVNVKEDVQELKSEVSSLRESIQSLTITVDKLAGAVAKLHDEFYATVEKVNRHEKWIKQIADKLGVKLEH